MVESFLFNSGKPGIRLVVFGAIHGNEHCGPKAIERVMEKLRGGSLTLRTGSVRFVPVCNRRAYETNVRYVEENLNRVFTKHPTPRSYEAGVANKLCALLDGEADMLLDVHSTSAPGPMSVFTDYPSETTDAFARSLGPSYILLDWPAVYADDPLGFRSSCTSDYAHEIGIPSVTVECGQHDDATSVKIAEIAILRALAFAGIIDARAETLFEPARIRMKYLVKKDADGDSFTKKWEHLEPIAAGTTIATRADGSTIAAESPSVMILPKHHATAGEEWFYTGVVEK